MNTNEHDAINDSSIAESIKISGLFALKMSLNSNESFLNSLNDNLSANASTPRAHQPNVDEKNLNSGGVLIPKSRTVSCAS